MIERLGYWILFAAVAVVFAHLAAQAGAAPGQRLVAAKAAHSFTHADCVRYDPYPDTFICPDLKMYHAQPGGWAFMGDLTQKHTSLPSIPRPDK